MTTFYTVASTRLRWREYWYFKPWCPFPFTALARLPPVRLPDSVRVQYQTDAAATSLWETHQRRLDDLYAGQAKRVATEDECRALSERLHETLRDFRVARGVYQPFSPGEQAAPAPPAAAPGL